MNTVEIHIREKRYHEPPTLAISELKLKASAGEIVAIVGPSGAGKSTLLNLVAGLDSDFDGTICSPVDNPRGNKYGQRMNDRRESRLGMVFQSPRLLPWLTAAQNVELVLEPTAHGRARAASLLRDVELEEFASAFPRQLSGGMQRRIALARAFAVYPSVLLLDEPFASLDVPGAWRLRELMLQLWAEQQPTVLVVTHDLREALCLADRVLFLSPRPARIVHTLDVSLARPRAPLGGAVQRLQEHLLAAHPQLLSGIANSSHNAGADNHADVGPKL